MKVTSAREGIPSPNEKAVQRLRSACEDFEAFLLGFMFKRAFQPVFGSSLFSSREESWFREMWVDEVTKCVAHQGSVGVAQILFRQLMKEKNLT